MEVVYDALVSVEVSGLGSEGLWGGRLPVDCSCLREVSEHRGRVIRSTKLD